MPYPGLLVKPHPSKITNTGDHDRFTHIVKRKDRRTARALVTQAIVEGFPVEALCGKIWVPSGDPKKYPLCPECEELAGLLLKG